MAISVTTMLEGMADDMGAGAGSTRFAGAFVRAANRAISQLNTRADLATPMSKITDTEGSFSSTLLDQDEYILWNGIRFYLLRSGFGSHDPKEIAALLADSKAEWEDSIGDFIARADNATQATAANDIAELGSRE